MILFISNEFLYKEIQWFVNFISTYSLFMNGETWLVIAFMILLEDFFCEITINLPWMSINLQKIKLIIPIFLGTFPAGNYMFKVNNRNTGVKYVESWL